MATPPPAPVTAVRTPAAPPQPADLVIGTVSANGTNRVTVVWAEPASGSGVAAPDEFLVTMRDPACGHVPPLVAEVPATQHTYSTLVTFPGQFVLSAYALSQQGGASAPAVRNGFIPDA